MTKMNNPFVTIVHFLRLMDDLGGADLRVSTVRVLLAIADRDQQGITTAELCERLDLQQPAVNRATLRLSSRGSKVSHSVGAPLGLITIGQDPVETRRYVFHLSPTGKKVLAMLAP